MALFSPKSPKAKKRLPAQVKREGAEAREKTGTDISAVLFSPRITEKATLVAQHNVYTFNISPRSTKREVAAAVQALYKVVPTKVRLVTIRPRTVMYRGKAGVKAGGKKAYVYLKEGDKIEVV